MPITTIGSYPPTMQEFIVHWTAVNASLGATPLTLRGGYSLANFTTDRASIGTAINNVIAQDNVAATTSGNLANLKAAIRLRIIQFRRWVLGYLPGTGYARSLPATPGLSAVESRFVDPLQDMLNLWTAINADATLTGIPLPLTLAGGYAVATFTTDLTALRAAYVTAKNATEQASLVRKQRDILLKPAEQRMKQYRDVIVARFDSTSPFVTSLPALSPPPGSTPDAVEITGEWNAAVGKARLNWTASTNANLDHYSVRACTGATYRTTNEFVVADLPPDTLTLDTVDALPIPGSQAVYRVYVVVASGNERGSNNAAVTRPDP